MSAEHERLDRQRQSLETKNQRVHQSKGIDRVESRSLKHARFFRRDRIVIIGISIRDAATAGSNALESAFEEGLQVYREGAGPRHLLRINQLLSGAKLASGDIVLHIRDHHRDDGPGLGDTRDFGDHSDLHDLRFDLPEAGEQDTLAGLIGNQDTSGTHQRIDDIAHAESELFHSPAHPSADNGLCQFDFNLGQRRFGAGFLSCRREETRCSAFCFAAVAAAIAPRLPSSST